MSCGIVARPGAHQRGLARPCLAVHEHQPPGAGERLVLQPAEGLDEMGPLDQCHAVSVGTRRGARGQEGRHAGQVEARVLGEHEALQLLQLGAGVDAQLVGEHRAGALVGRERVALPTTTIERGHEQRPERLPHRVPPHERLKLGHRRRGTGTSEVGGDPALERVEPQGAQASGVGVERRASGELGVRRAPPEAQGVGERRRWPRRAGLR